MWPSRWLFYLGSKFCFAYKLDVSCWACGCNWMGLGWKCQILCQLFYFHVANKNGNLKTFSMTQNPNRFYTDSSPFLSFSTHFHVGNFSRLTVNFRFERQIGHHLIQTFAPSTLVVMLSWFSFWLGLDAIPGRVTLLVTCMLTLVTMFTGLRADIPPVAYVKVSFSFCIGFITFYV